MSTVSSPIARVIAELETERANLTVRLEKVDAAIATMRELFHLPNGKPLAKAREPKHSGIRKARVPAETNGKGKGDTLKAAIRSALEHGPLTPAELETKRDRRYTPTSRVAQLEADGLVVATGNTASRSIALAGKPAKEAPQR